MVGGFQIKGSRALDLWLGICTWYDSLEDVRIEGWVSKLRVGFGTM